MRNCSGVDELDHLGGVGQAHVDDGGVHVLRGDRPHQRPAVDLLQHRVGAALGRQINQAADELRPLRLPLLDTSSWTTG